LYFDFFRVYDIDEEDKKKEEDISVKLLYSSQVYHAPITSVYKEKFQQQGALETLHQYYHAVF